MSMQISTISSPKVDPLAPSNVRSPSHVFYSMGQFTEQKPAEKRQSLINFLKIRRHNAMPGVSAKKHQRNVSETAMNKEMDIKPQLHSQFSKQFYLPGKYLNPMASPESKFHNR